MNRCRGVLTCLLVILAVSGLALSSWAGSMPKPGEVFPCVAEGKLDKKIAPEAELVDFSCVFKKWEGMETLHFNVAVKNISKDPQRFRVHIFLDNGKAVGGLLPVKSAEGLVKPGETAKFVYPVPDMGKKAEAISLIITTKKE